MLHQSVCMTSYTPLATLNLSLHNVEYCGSTNNCKLHVWQKIENVEHHTLVDLLRAGSSF